MKFQLFGNSEQLRLTEKKYNTKFYNLDMIISLGYRIKSSIATRFRQWATKRLNEYIRKGFTMDDDRLKNLGGGGYWKELLERIRDIRASEKVFYIKADDLISNMHEVQKRNNLPLTNDTLENGKFDPSFCIEMETGTGKTYVYTKTIFEPHKRYGFTKFIIVVPSVAIREGVSKSLNNIETKNLLEDMTKYSKYYHAISCADMGNTVAKVYT